MKTIASIATTICTLMGTENPRLSTEPPLDEIFSEAKRILEGEKIDRCLIYAPDAIGEALYRDQRDQFVGVERLAPTSILLRSMVPPKTPVCFASMFTARAAVKLDVESRSNQHALYFVVAFETGGRGAETILLRPRARRYWIIKIMGKTSSFQLNMY